ncbi:hypothetical protein BKA65DRAFT_595091 [Rhexocercosporidium sp. MPI-PUGE-AT-0058]|nr:hypothetical protein BKA65DRAFT_595091 [Rhexocercosporidium sp. MPI-PUGE-AT-0058]
MASKRKSSPLGPAPTRLRQIALVAENLEKARHLLTTVIGTEVIFEDPAVEQWGLKNILVPIGGDIIEVVSPFLPTAPATRHLTKHGPGGYMLIMQTHHPSALKRLANIKAHHLAQPIFTHSTPESDMVQYHPKGIPGGVIPELDSHREHPEHPDPLRERFSPWHAAGPGERYAVYREGMRRAGGLWLVSVMVRLKDGDGGVEGAARRWEDVFGVQRGEGSGEVVFTNAKMQFLRGEQGRKDGLVEVGIAVEGRGMRDGILARAREEGLGVEGDVVDMLGISWRFMVRDPNEEERMSKL